MTTMNKIICATALTTGLIASHAQAGATTPAFAGKVTQSPFELQLRAGYSAGGDKIGPVISDAHGQSQVSAGSGLMVGGGINYYLNTAYPTFLSANLHIMADQANSRESEIRFTRFPVDLMLGSHYRNFRFAGGITHHINPSLEYKWDSDGNQFDKEESVSESFGSATGQVAEMSYKVERVDLNLRYTHIEYNFAGVKVDGSGMAVSVILRF